MGLITLIALIIVGLIVAIAGLHSLGNKARKLERTDQDFLQQQLVLGKNECYRISRQFSRQLASERKRYINAETNGDIGYNEWMTKGVDTFFESKVSPRLVNAQRECLIQFSAYTEIIDRVAATAPSEN